MPKTKNSKEKDHITKTLISLVILVSAFSTAAQSLTVETYPPLGVYGTISGHAGGVDPAMFKIAIVNDVFDSYWSKPYDFRPTVPINVSDSSFEAVFITGGQDSCAKKIYLFLVPIDATVPITLGGAGIPDSLREMAVATAVVDRTSASNQFVWSGYTWTKKDTGDCIWGPGPNHFSGDNVFVDELGKLHLKISYTNGQWYCPEIISTQSFGYGSYRFFIDSVPTNLPGPITVGWFVYDDGALPYHREIDIEFSNGAVVGSEAPWQYVVQPYTLNRYRFVTPTNFTSSVQTFLWMPGVTRFASYGSLPQYTGIRKATYTIEARIELEFSYWDALFGLAPIEMTVPGRSVTHYESFNFWFTYAYFRARLSNIVEDTDLAPYVSWTTTSGIPELGKEKVHINMWLFNGTAPGETNKTFEVVVNSFEFEPIDPASLVPKINLLNVQNQHHTDMDIELTVPAK